MTVKHAQILFLILLVTGTLSSPAREPEFRVTFTGIGDNREFHNGYARAQTILGAQAMAEAGVRIDRHALYAGISGLYEFGSAQAFHNPRPILYYRFEVPATKFLFGSFPRGEHLGFPLAMLADTLLYYRPLLEGLLGELRWNGGRQYAFADWTGRQDRETRESFMAGSAGEIRFGSFFFQNYLLLNHLAHTYPKTPGQHIRDHLAFCLLAGVETKKEKTFSGHFRGGVLTSAYRERSVTGGFLTGASLLCEAYGQYRHLALRSTLHAGQPHHFAHGDPFYRFGRYLRTDAVWYFINHKNVRGRFNLSLHLAEGNKRDLSQQLSLVYLLER